MSTTVADIDEALAHASRLDPTMRAQYVDRLLDERLLLSGKARYRRARSTPSHQAPDSSRH